MSMATSLEKRLKAAVDALASGGSPKPVNVIRNGGDTPTPTPPVPPVPEPVKATFMGTITGEVGKISATRGKGGDPYPVELTIYNSSQVEVASGSFTAEDVAPLEVVDEDIVAGTYSVHVVWLGTNEGEPTWFYDDVEVVIAEPVVDPDQDPLPSGAAASSAGGYYIQGMNGASVEFSSNGTTLSSGTIDQESSGTYYYRDSDTSDLPAVGTTLDITVSLSGYKDWTGTVAVTGGK